jgi:ABC-type sulfate transport system permease component
VPPPAPFQRRALYLTYTALLHAFVFLTVVAVLPYDSALSAAAAAGGAATDGVIASWRAAVYIRFAGAALALLFSTLAALSPGEGVNVHFQAR